MILDILQHPDSRLAEVCDDAVPGPESAQLLADLADTCISSNGLGLAAPQVGKNIRAICVMATDAYGMKSALGMLNPRITKRSGIKLTELESCLSVDGGRASRHVTRAVSITVEAQNADGSTLVFDAKNLMARVIQHEVDHLNGVTILDHTPPRKKRAMRAGATT